MLNVPMLDNQKVIVTSNPKTQSGIDRTQAIIGWGVLNGDPDLLDVTLLPGNAVNPFFEVKPKIRFFGAPRLVTLTLRAQNVVDGPFVETGMTVTVNGSLPDNGELDHFEPSAGEPVAQ